MDTSRLRAQGKDFRLADHDPRDSGEFKDKAAAAEALKTSCDRLRDLQEKLYAQDRWAMLLIFQAMDAAGKDSAIKHVMSGLNPQGCQVFSFKAPSHEELDHDFLWRTSRALPERGRIGVFNRSYYEEVLIVRVHEDILRGQKLPPELVTDRIWDERFQDIRAHERYLCRNGILIRKFFLNVSKKEQKKRFLERLDRPEKNWKFSAQDALERRHWDRYMAAYEEAIAHTSTDEAPWYVIPADRKWYARLAVAEVIVEAMEGLHLEFPKLGERQLRDLEEARRILTTED